MSSKRLAGRFLRSTMLSGVAAIAALPAVAQDDGDADDTIVVTGSRLNQANISSSSPVLQLEAGEIDTRGNSRIEDFINILPSAFAAQTSELANGSNGTSTLNLRGLGSRRTLVLLDGKRLPFGSPGSSSVNLDLIPTQLVERVDIVTGGASAVYGSDAVAGVANFILRRDYEGMMFDGQVGFYQDGNSEEFSNALLSVNGFPLPGGKTDGRDVVATITFGANTADGRGNVTAFLSYQDQNEIRQDARDFSACAFAPSGPAPNTIGGIGCTGSSTFRRFFTPGGDFFLDSSNTLVPFLNTPAQTFNFAPDNFIQRNNERFNITALSRYEITDNIEAWLDLTFTENTTDSQIAFSGTFFRSFQTNCANPLLDNPVSTGGTLADALGCTAALIAADTNVPLTVGYRNVTGDPRSSFRGLSTFRMVGGFRGDLGDNWSWDTFGQFSRTRANFISTGDLSFADVQDGLFVIDDPLNPGTPICQSGNSGCLPFNLFDFQGVTPAAAQFAQGNGFVTGTTEQIVLGGTLQADLGDYGFQFPWAENSVQGLLGMEYRRDNLNSQPDDISQIPGGMGLTGVGGGTLPVQGEVSVVEAFMEASIPLVEGRPFFEELGLNGAYRFSDYATDGNGIQNSFQTHTFAAGATWTPVADIRFRAQFQRAVRAPNVIELFTGQNTGLFNAAAGANGLFDPCAGDLIAATPLPAPSATAAQCAFTGVSAAQYGTIPDNPAGQLNTATGGNPLLIPEKADTYTLGIVVQPRWFDGLVVSADYFDITVQDAITTVPQQTTLSQCIATGDPSFCGLIVRDGFGSLFLSSFTPTGSIAGVAAVNTNIADFATRGIDFALNYNTDIDGIFGLFDSDMGSMSFNYVSTVLMELSSVPVPGVTTTTECKGLYRGSCGGPNPKYRHRLLTTWQTPWDLDITATWRHTGGVLLDTGQASGGTFTSTGNSLDDFLDSANYLDLSASLHVREGLTIRTGVQNVMGRDPELSTQAGTAPGNGDTFPGTYDSAGRFIFFGVNIEL